MGVPVWRSKVMYVPQRPSAHAGTPLDLFRQASKYASQAKKEHLGDPVRNQCKDLKSIDVLAKRELTPIDRLSLDLNGD